MPAHARSIYNGTEMFVISMNIGTTQSTVCFAHLVPGTPPQTKMVAWWPGQAQAACAANVPTTVSYREGVMQACGEDVMPNLEDDHPDVAHWFKLHLHPSAMPRPPGFKIPKLPPGVSVELAYTDMMRYLMDHTRTFHERTTPNGEEIWTRLRGQMIIFLATPNEWDNRERGTIRKAAVKAGIVTEENAEQLLHFVPEPEAAVHYTLQHSPRSWPQKDTTFAVVDAGSCTVDITVYKCASMDPLRQQEVRASECVQAGDIFVNLAVEKLLSGRLKGLPPYGTPDVIRRMIDAFEKEVKYKFDGSQPSYHINFGGAKDTVPSLGINGGRITISMEDLKAAFDTAVKEIVTCCTRTLKMHNPKYILLIGGFGESPYLQKALVDTFNARGTQVVVAGDQLTGAVAEGATLACIKKLVVARSATATFGGCARQLYDRKVHHTRKRSAYIDTDGKKRVKDTFHPWVFKGTILEENFAHRLHYSNLWDASSTTKYDLVEQLGKIVTEVYAWEGDGQAPAWCKDVDGRLMPGMRLMCTLHADFSALASSLTVTPGGGGTQFYQVTYDVYVYFGGAELRASLEWREGRSTHQGPVAVIPHDPYEEWRRALSSSVSG